MAPVTAMEPNKSTASIIAEVEKLSGYPVLLAQDTSLTTLATVQAATASQPVHTIRYRSGREAADYQIAFECGFLIRMLQLTPGDRVQLAARPEARERLIREILQVNPTLAPDAARHVGTMLFDGLMVQLRSSGPGIKVDLWLFSEHPDLRDLQAESMEQQARENASTLNPDLDRHFPASVVRASRAMNSAHALFAADLLQRPHLAIPYQAAGFEGIGRTLLAVVADPTRDRSDREIIDQWAQLLGIADWYEWVPAETPVR